jgi:hypothetical protein
MRADRALAVAVEAARVTFTAGVRTMPSPATVIWPRQWRCRWLQLIAAATRRTEQLYLDCRRRAAETLCGLGL